MTEIPYDTEKTNQDTDRSSSLRGSRILVVDDSANNLQVIGTLLKKYECEVLIAQSSHAAIKIAESKFPDLILLDVLMPGMDGFETHNLLSQNQVTSEIPVIYLSASSNAGNIVRGFRQGAHDYIVKPFNPKELVSRVANQLNKTTKHSQMRMLFNSKLHSYVTINKELEITGFNQTAHDNEPLFIQEKLSNGESVFSCVHREDQVFLKRRIEAAFRGRQVEFEKKYKVGGFTKWYNYTIEPIKDNGKNIRGYVISGTEVTSKKETEIEDAEFLQKINDVHHETQQSLAYASHIQQAILPKEAEISSYLKESFVMFKPKEKVSGDFFWTHEQDDKTLLVLGDCTGHGVPGALLTTISIVLLERIIKYQKIDSPERILSELNSNIVTILKQNNGGVKDGLEMAVCLFHKKTRLLEFAGAKRSLVMVNTGELSEIKGDRMEIGGDEKKKFTKHLLKPLPNTAIYLHSDGITDQIGGEKNKKFLKKRFHQLILSVSRENMSRQKNLFSQALDNWMGRGEQTDDILLIGARI